MVNPPTIVSSSIPSETIVPIEFTNSTEIANEPSSSRLDYKPMSPQPPPPQPPLKIRNPRNIMTDDDGDTDADKYRRHFSPTKKSNNSILGFVVVIILPLSSNFITSLNYYV